MHAHIFEVYLWSGVALIFLLSGLISSWIIYRQEKRLGNRIGNLMEKLQDQLAQKNREQTND